MSDDLYLWVDDERPPPQGWISATTADLAIYLLHTLPISIVSLDHDLGGDLTGYDIACWLEQNLLDAPEDLRCHSMNPVGRTNIERVFGSIERHRERP